MQSTPQKPNPQGFLNILKYFDKAPKSAAVIGDRPGTDMWGAHMVKINNLLLVVPLSKKAPLFIKITRKIENILF